MKKTVALTFATSVLIPALAFAQNFTYINNWLNQGIYWLRLAVTLIMVLMTLTFLYSVWKFIANKEPKDTPVLKDNMINGMIGLFVAVGIWGILKIAGGVVGIDTTTSSKYDTPGITCPPGLSYVKATGTCEK